MINEVLAIEAEAAKEAGALGFMARSLIQATMPHRNPGAVEVWGRRNGDFSLVMQPGYILDRDNNPQNIGLPYGTKPRLIMAFLVSEAVKTGDKKIILGKSLSEFMQKIGLIPSGGRWGTIPMLKEQMKRLFSASISFQYDGAKMVDINGGMKIASRTVLFWDTKLPKQTSFWESTVLLTQEFFDEIITRPVPVDLRALSALKDSSLAIDIYCWLTYRLYYLESKTEIPWAVLALQFGCNYARARDFKKQFVEQLRKVTLVYKDANLEIGRHGLVLKPSKNSLPSRRLRLK